MRPCLQSSGPGGGDNCVRRKPQACRWSAEIREAARGTVAELRSARNRGPVQSNGMW